MTPCQNPHFILASFTLICCLLETSLITAGAQTQVYFRNSKQTFRAVTIIEIGALLPLPDIFCGWIYACIWRAGAKFQALLVVGTGKKNFELQHSLHQSAWAVAVRAASVSQPDLATISCDWQSSQPVCRDCVWPEWVRNALLQCRHQQSEPWAMLWSGKSQPAS